MQNSAMMLNEGVTVSEEALKIVYENDLFMEKLTFACLAEDYSLAVINKNSNKDTGSSSDDSSDEKSSPEKVSRAKKILETVKKWIATVGQKIKELCKKIVVTLQDMYSTDLLTVKKLDQKSILNITLEGPDPDIFANNKKETDNINEFFNYIAAISEFLKQQTTTAIQDKKDTRLTIAKTLANEKEKIDRVFHAFDEDFEVSRNQYNKDDIIDAMKNKYALMQINVVAKNAKILLMMTKKQLTL